MPGRVDRLDRFKSQFDFLFLVGLTVVGANFWPNCQQSLQLQASGTSYVLAPFPFQQHLRKAIQRYFSIDLEIDREYRKGLSISWPLRNNSSMSLSLSVSHPSWRITRLSNGFRILISVRTCLFCMQAQNTCQRGCCMLFKIVILIRASGGSCFHNTRIFPRNSGRCSMSRFPYLK